MSTTETNLTHFDASGNAVMVDVSEKAVTFREAVAHGITVSYTHLTLPTIGAV